VAARCFPEFTSALSAENRLISQAGGIHLVEKSAAQAASKTGAKYLGGTESEILCHPFLEGVE